MRSKLRATPLLFALVLPFASCSGIKTYVLALHGDAKLNPNERNNSTAVPVKVLQLKGEESATALRSAAFESLWEDPITAKNVVIVGVPQTLYVPPRGECVKVELKEVPPEVTHVAVLGRFNNPVTDKERVVFSRDKFSNLEVWLHGSVIEATAPTAPAAPAATAKPGT